MRQAADNGAVTSPSSVLELGCGHGLPGIHALQQGGWADGRFLLIDSQGSLCDKTCIHFHPRKLLVE